MIIILILQFEFLYSNQFMALSQSAIKFNKAFDYPSFDEWIKTAQQELGGDDPLVKLRKRKDGIEILPFYNQDYPLHKKPFPIQVSANPYAGARFWKNISHIDVKDEKLANELALHFLNSGAEGILFNCDAKSLDINSLLNNISLADCTVSFELTRETSDLAEQFNVFAEQSAKKEDIQGQFYWKSNPSDINKIINLFSDWNSFRAIGLLVSVGNPDEEIAKALYHIVLLMEENKSDPQKILDQVSFSVEVGNDFFLEIAKLKTLRNLWYQLRGAYDTLTHYKPLHIHAVSNAWVAEKYQPHGNMIKSTTSAMAAIMGGCDSLQVQPEDQHNNMMFRIARNVSSILREESHFDKVADTSAGSYYIDSLIDQLSQKTWMKFQSML